MFNLQYAGFLAIILVIELAIAASLYAYKDHLADGLHKGLNQSIHKYGPDAVMKSADFDAMQANVSRKHKNIKPLTKKKCILSMLCVSHKNIYTKVYLR